MFWIYWCLLLGSVFRLDIEDSRFLFFIWHLSWSNKPLYSRLSFTLLVWLRGLFKNAWRLVELELILDIIYHVLCHRAVMFSSSVLLGLSCLTIYLASHLVTLSFGVQLKSSSPEPRWHELNSWFQRIMAVLTIKLRIQHWATRQSWQEGALNTHFE